MDLPEANSTSYCRRDLYCRPVSSLPLSVMVCSCHACVNLRVVFVSWALRRHCTLAVALYRHDSGLGISHARNHLITFGLHEILKCAHLKFTVYGRKQTYTQLPQMQSRWCGARSGSPQLWWIYFTNKTRSR